MEHRKEDIAIIKKYLSGAMSPREMYELERRAQQDPLLMDLMEGMEKEPLQAHQIHVETIAAQIKERIQSGRAPRKLWSTWMAAASLVFALLAIGFWLINRPQEKELIANQVNKPILKDTAAPTILSDTVPLVAAVPQSAPAPRIQKKRQSVERRQASSNAVRQAARPVRVEAETPVISADNLLAEAGQELNRDTNVLIAEHTTNVSGRVVDEETKAPLPGVVVRALGLNKATTTDEQGRFYLEVPKEKDRVEVSYLGYTQKNVQIAGENSLQIAMTPDHAALEEVVVVEYGAQSKSNRVGAIEVAQQKPDKNIRIRGVNSEISEAAPLIGWDAYKAYLNKEAAVFDGHTGTVRLLFDLDAQGKPVDIRIKQGGDAKLEKRAIDMIKNGSAWIKGTVEVEIDISITFDKP